MESSQSMAAMPRPKKMVSSDSHAGVANPESARSPSGR